MKRSVISAQRESIKALGEAIRSFLKMGSKTRVIPLSIPTGWGKTRIALQGIIRQDYPTGPPSIIIWPQTVSHISDEVWKDKISWCPKSVPCNNCTPPEIFKLAVSKPGKKKNRELIPFSPHRGKKFVGNFYYINNNFDGIKNALDRSRGPIIFIIDEWHSKNLLDEYEKGTDAEKFWRNKLLGPGNTRQLFVILVSATPIGATSDIDNIQTEQDDDYFEQQVEDALKKFQQLTKVGNQSREYNLYKVYPELIKREAKALRQKQVNERYEVEIVKKDWLAEYTRLMRKVYGNRNETPSNPILVYPLESLVLSGVTKEFSKEFPSLKKYFRTGFERQTETSKLETVRNLLGKYPNQKFVIFCHYKAVITSLENYLHRIGIKWCGHNELDDFNDRDSGPRVLIVMDKHSQGISMHQSNAWLIHFELSWNPIRIIQRYGRVWRIDKVEGSLTKPLAFYIPHTFSSDEEMIRRLKRRWEVLEKISGEKEANYVNLAPISFDVALGIRCSPNFLLDKL